MPWARRATRRRRSGITANTGNTTSRSSARGINNPRPAPAALAAPLAHLAGQIVLAPDSHGDRRRLPRLVELARWSPGRVRGPRRAAPTGKFADPGIAPGGLRHHQPARAA